MINFNNIPKILQDNALWCVWKYDEKKSKLPFNPATGKMAKSNDTTTFANFEIAQNSYRTGNYDGVGIGIFNGFCAIDIDHCIENGTYSDMATDIIKEMNSYTEISPSGEGIRIIFTVQDFSFDKDQYYIMNSHKGLEVYVCGATQKYVTITGNCIKDRDIVMAEQSLQRVLERYMRRDMEESKETVSAQSDNETDSWKIGLEKDKKLKFYWNGGRYSNKSESENDFGFMNKLMYWTNNDIEKAITAFLSSPYTQQKDDAHKQKLQRDDYLLRTAIHATASKTAEQTNLEYLSKQQTITQEKNNFELISAIDLQNMDLPPVKYLVEDILPEGTSILAAPSKIGKSWFVLDMGLSIAAGKSFLNKKTNPVGVLYLALEDNKQRLQDRMNKLLNDDIAPKNFYFMTKSPTLETDLLTQLENNIKQDESIKLIIIDTLQKIRGQALPRENAYQQDYREIGMIKEFADKHNISIFFVHHTRKMKDDCDPYNMISGTNGIMGVADTILMITKKKRTDKKAVLNITGRDVEQSDLVVQFNKSDYRWNVVGSVLEVKAQEEKENYQNNPIVLSIKTLLQESDTHKWDGTAKNLIESIEEKTNLPIATTPQQLSKELESFKDSLFYYDRIIYHTTPNGNAGRHHHFRYCGQVSYIPKEYKK